MLGVPVFTVTKTIIFKISFHPFVLVELLTCFFVFFAELYSVTLESAQLFRVQ